MIGILFLFLSISFGWTIRLFLFPNQKAYTAMTYDKKPIALSPSLMFFPLCFFTGTLALTWLTYLTAYILSWTDQPLLIANIISITIGVVVSLGGVYKYSKNKEVRSHTISNPGDKKAKRMELIFLLAVTALASSLMWRTFYMSHGNLYVGITVFSDFSPHIGMIRSFSQGNNIPTWYSHFAGEDIKYHFMFQFLVGNLEYLGLRLDYAFNIPSILSLISAFSMIYVLAMKVTGKISAALLSGLFFAFRSSKSLFTYLAELSERETIRDALLENTDFIGYTPNEDWGLWNLNVYGNQRHLAFGLTVAFFILILFIPHLYETWEQWKSHKRDQGGRRLQDWKEGFMILFFSKEGWIVKDAKVPIASGVILGSLAFFHGSAVIGCLLVLFVIAIVARRRLEFVIVALIAVGMSVLQTELFVKDSFVSAEFLYGFIAEQKTLFGVLSYLERLLGVLPYVLLVAFCIEKGVKRYLMLAFLAPLIFAFHVSLTVDVTVNHKYIMMSTILLGILAASLLSRVVEKKDIILRTVGILLVGALTLTGVYDYITVLRKNSPKAAVVLDMGSPLTQWIIDHSDADDIFLTSNYALNQVVLGGAMLYQGWQYFPWSAGYDTAYRDLMVKRMYEAKTPKELADLVEQNNIRYIIVDHDNRVSTDYEVNEDTIRRSYECVYQEGEGDWLRSIYDTQKPTNFNFYSE